MVERWTLASEVWSLTTPDEDWKRARRGGNTALMLTNSALLLLVSIDHLDYEPVSRARHRDSPRTTRRLLGSISDLTRDRKTIDGKPMRKTTVQDVVSADVPHTLDWRRRESDGLSGECPADTGHEQGSFVLAASPGLRQILMQSSRIVMGRTVAESDVRLSQDVDGRPRLCAFHAMLELNRPRGQRRPGSDRASGAKAGKRP